MNAPRVPQRFTRTGERDRLRGYADDCIHYGLGQSCMKSMGRIYVEGLI